VQENQHLQMNDSRKTMHYRKSISQSLDSSNYDRGQHYKRMKDRRDKFSKTQGEVFTNYKKTKHIGHGTQSFTNWYEVWIHQIGRRLNTIIDVFKMSTLEDPLYNCQKVVPLSDQARTTYTVTNPDLQLMV
jgi:hypothetical protein